MLHSSSIEEASTGQTLRMQLKIRGIFSAETKFMLIFINLCPITNAKVMFYDKVRKIKVITRPNYK